MILIVNFKIKAINPRLFYHVKIRIPLSLNFFNSAGLNIIKMLLSLVNKATSNPHCIKFEKEVLFL
jgi:hypothetical protein